MYGEVSAGTNRRVLVAVRGRPAGFAPLFPPWVVCDAGEQRAFTSTKPSRLPKALPSKAQTLLLLDRVE